ncbi:MAG: YifB family Mg chelatase-like AAA ATPase [Holosporaceae bacterium]|jgi:magnesium chelatase family protein|nr:YifB family Mg chelatase-like AAA ATPase [Holosporaceae bacterium]
MNANIKTVSFLGISTIEIDVQIQMLNGLPAFTIVGLPDKTVAESRERIRACLYSMGIALPSKRITVNLAPADVQKEGSHYDLPIALALLTAMGVVQQEDVDNAVAVGELALNGALAKVPGVLPAAIWAKSQNKILICPEEQAQEAVWAGENQILAPAHLLSLINHFKGTQILPRIVAKNSEYTVKPSHIGCFSDIKGQMTAKRAMEIAAAGNHNVLMLGPPGVGKSLLASKIPSIMPPITSEEALEVTMIHSLAGMISDVGLVTERPYRAPHHSASLVALVGGGVNAKPGEISLAHRGVLFLDELPEFSRTALESLRQPLETGNITIARANNHVTYPARIQLVAAMNPCRCGYLGNTEKECNLAPKCGKDYLRKISGPLLDRIDIFVDVPDVKISDFIQSQENIEKSEAIRTRVIAAREIQLDRYKNLQLSTNAEANGHELEHYLTDGAKEVLYKCIDRAKISARGYYRVVKLARTLADLAKSDVVDREQVMEALSHRRIA